MTTTTVSTVNFQPVSRFSATEVYKGVPQKVATRKLLQSTTKDYLDESLLPTKFGPDVHNLSRAIPRRKYRKGSPGYNLELNSVASSESATAIDPRHDRLVELRAKYSRLDPESDFKRDFSNFIGFVLHDCEWSHFNARNYALGLCPSFVSWVYGAPLVNFHEAYRRFKSGTLSYVSLTDTHRRKRTVLLRAFVCLYSQEFPAVSRSMCFAVDALSSMHKTKSQMKTAKPDDRAETIPLNPPTLASSIYRSAVDSTSTFAAQVLEQSASKVDTTAIGATICSSLTGTISKSLTEFWNSICTSVSSVWSVLTECPYLTFFVICLVFFLSIALWFFGAFFLSKFTVSNQPCEEYIVTTVAQSNFNTPVSALKEYDLWTRRISSTKSALEALSLLWNKTLDLVDACWIRATGKPLTDRNKDVLNFETAYADVVSTMESYIEKPFDQNTCGRFIASYKTLQDLHLKCVSDKNLSTSIGTVLAKFTSHYANALRVASTDGGRHTPMSVYFSGPPHSGKTTIVNVLAKEFATRTNSPDTIWFRNGACEFWDGYRVQTAIVFDDIFKAKDPALRLVEAEAVINAVNTSAYPLPMSAIVDKASTYFLSPLVIATSNLTFTGSSFDGCGLTDRGAFMRRWMFVFECPVVAATGADFPEALANSTIVVKQCIMQVGGKNPPGITHVEVFRGRPTDAVNFAIETYLKKSSEIVPVDYQSLEALKRPDWPNVNATPFVPKTSSVSARPSDSPITVTTTTTTTNTVTTGTTTITLTDSVKLTPSQMDSVSKRVKSRDSVVVASDGMPSPLLSVDSDDEFRDASDDFSNQPFPAGRDYVRGLFQSDADFASDMKTLSDAKDPVGLASKMIDLRKKLTGEDDPDFSAFILATALNEVAARKAIANKIARVKVEHGDIKQVEPSYEVPLKATKDSWGASAGGDDCGIERGVFVSKETEDRAIDALVALAQGRIVPGVFREVDLKSSVVDAETLEPVVTTDYDVHFLCRDTKRFEGSEELLLLSTPKWFLKIARVAEFHRLRPFPEPGKVAILAQVTERASKPRHVFVSVARLAWWYECGRTVTPMKFFGLCPTPFGDKIARACVFRETQRLLSPVSEFTVKDDHIDPFADDWFANLKYKVSKVWKGFLLFCAVLAAVVVAIYCLFKFVFRTEEVPTAVEVEQVLAGSATDSCDRLFDRRAQSVPLKTPKVNVNRTVHSVPLKPKPVKMNRNAHTKLIPNLSYDSETGELTDPNQYITHSQMTAGDSSRSTDGQFSAIKSNVRYVEMVRNGEVVASQHAFCFHEGVVGFNHHFYKHALASGSTHFRINACGNKSVLVDLKLLVSQQRVVEWPDKDWTFVFVNTLSFKNVTKWLVNEPISMDEVISVVRLRLENMKHDGEYDLMPIKDVFMSDLHLRTGLEQFDSDVGVYTQRNTFYVKDTGRPGYCGAPLLVQMRDGMWRILGFHCGGHSNYSSFSSMSKTAVTEKINSLFSGPVVRTRSQCGTRNSVVPYELRGKGPFAHLHNVRLSPEYAVEGGFDVMGALSQKIFTPVDTKLTKSVFMMEDLTTNDGLETLPPLFPLKTAPAVLRRNKEVDPWNRYVSKLGKVVTRDDYPGSEDPQNWEGVFPPVLDSRPSWRKLTIEEAIYGVGSLPPIALNTASGGSWTFRGITRKQIFTTPILMAELYARVHHYETLMEQNKPLAPLFIAFPKDEKRPEEKVASGDSRFVFTAPVEFFIFCRMYFGFFLISRDKHLHDTEMAIGFNPYGVDWHTMCSEFERFDLFFDGDIQFYDGHYPIPTLDHFVPAARVYYRNVPDCLTFILFHSVHIYVVFEAKLYRVILLPSGWLLTAFANSAINTVGNNIVLSHMKRPVHKKKVLGDDLFMGVKYGFDVDTFVRLRKEIMCWTTTAAVKTETVRLKTMEECQFLKRGFVKDGMYWRGPLDLDSIHNMLTWVRAKTFKQVLFQSKTNWEIARSELSLYPREVFDHYKNLCEPRLEEFGVPVPDYSYDQVKLAVDAHLYG